jgi:hypothetical protein
MFTLYFFQGNDVMTAAAIADGTAKFLDDYVREGDFATFRQATDRMNNIGSRWIFYSNACIIDDQGEVIGIYMADGFNIEHKDYVYV